MSDGQKSCAGFAALFLGMGLAVLSLTAAGVSELIRFFSGNSLGIDLRTGLIIGGVLFALCFLTAIYFFISVRDWSWFPAIISGVYAVLPDLIPGPEDDILAIVFGVVLSVILSFLKSRVDRKMAASRPEQPPNLIDENK